MTWLPTPVKALLVVALLGSGVALLLLREPSPALLGLAALWLAGLLARSLRAGRNGSSDVRSAR